MTTFLFIVEYFATDLFIEKLINHVLLLPRLKMNRLRCWITIGIVSILAIIIAIILWLVLSRKHKFYIDSNENYCEFDKL